ncbi:MAG: ABC transporter ATP-binding protein [Candidatus Marinimicrobia bacterium]|nr:ABC transporter ATP-binding protein [Candidatus Neomarinimicrobiota bacterium]
MFSLKSLTKTYIHRNENIHAINHISLEIQGGSFIAITGGSGSGKTTLLLTLGGLIRPTSGLVKYKGLDIYGLPPEKIADYRNNTVGFVLQTFNLIPYLSALENVIVPLLILKKSNIDKRKRASTLLKKLGLSSRQDFLPRELSLGQQQRVAIARALANDPEVILADEPTGNLDPVLKIEILDILHDLNKQENRTLILVTHDPDSARRADRVLNLSNGEII